MRKEERTLKNKAKYIGAELEFSLDPAVPMSEHTKASLELVRASLESAGVILDVNGRTLRIAIDKDSFTDRHYRNAGKNDKSAMFRTNAVGLAGCKVYYKDYLKMMQSMSDKEIMEETGMAHATYYRHKKAFMESEYYKSIDMTRLGDEEYIEEGDGNSLLF